MLPKGTVSHTAPTLYIFVKSLPGGCCSACGCVILQGRAFCCALVPCRAFLRIMVSSWRPHVVSRVMPHAWHCRVLFLLRSSVLACVLSVSPWSILCRRSCHASFICPEGSRGFQCRKGSEVAHVPNLLENRLNKPRRACRTIPALHSCSGLSLHPETPR